MNLRADLTILLFTLGLTAFGQNETEYKTKPAFILTGGVCYQKQLMGDVGVAYGTLDISGPCSAGGLRGLRLGSEFNFKSDFIMGPKIGLEYSFATLGLRLNLIDYTDFKSSDLKLVPEIGLTTGVFDLFYGYNFSLGNNNIQGISNSRVSLVVNYNRKTWKGD